MIKNGVVLMEKIELFTRQHFMLSKAGKKREKREERERREREKREERAAAQRLKKK